MLSRKPPKRLFKNKDVVHTYEHDRSTKSAFKHMTRDHVDVLQNIEFALVTAARDEPKIDDDVIDRALRACIDQTEAHEDADPRVAAICGMLMRTRTMREDVTDEIWSAGLRTVQKSVRRHSSLAPAETNYLDFVRQYVA